MPYTLTSENQEQQLHEDICSCFFLQQLITRGDLRSVVDAALPNGPEVEAEHSVDQVGQTSDQGAEELPHVPWVNLIELIEIELSAEATTNREKSSTDGRGSSSPA